MYVLGVVIHSPLGFTIKHSKTAYIFRYIPCIPSDAVQPRICFFLFTSVFFAVFPSKEEVEYQQQTRNSSAHRCFSRKLPYKDFNSAQWIIRMAYPPLGLCIKIDTKNHIDVFKNGLMSIFWLSISIYISQNVGGIIAACHHCSEQGSAGETYLWNGRQDFVSTFVPKIRCLGSLWF